jgi:hypothetical protein
MRAHEFAGGNTGLDQMTKYATSHYNDKNKTRALMKLLARSAMHGYDEDVQQEIEIARLAKEIADVKKQLVQLKNTRPINASGAMNENASVGATSSGSVAPVSMPLGGTISRGGNLLGGKTVSNSDPYPNTPDWIRKAKKQWTSKK